MNTKIIRNLNDAAGKYESLCDAGESVVSAHNVAAANGFIDIPTLDYHNTFEYEDSIVVSVSPKSGLISIDDLYNLKHAWGADNIEVSMEDKTIDIEFLKK